MVSGRSERHARCGTLPQKKTAPSPANLTESLHVDEIIHTSA